MNYNKTNKYSRLQKAAEIILIKKSPFAYPKIFSAKLVEFVQKSAPKADS
jgi:hypothetical protein